MDSVEGATLPKSFAIHFRATRAGFVLENNIIVAVLMSENHLFVLYYLTVLVFIKTVIHLSVGG